MSQFSKLFKIGYNLSVVYFQWESIILLTDCPLYLTIGAVFGVWICGLLEHRRRIVQWLAIFTMLLGLLVGLNVGMDYMETISGIMGLGIGLQWILTVCKLQRFITCYARIYCSPSSSPLSQSLPSPSSRNEDLRVESRSTFMLGFTFSRLMTLGIMYFLMGLSIAIAHTTQMDSTTTIILYTIFTLGMGFINWKPRKIYSSDSDFFENFTTHYCHIIILGLAAFCLEYAHFVPLDYVSQDMNGIMNGILHWIVLFGFCFGWALFPRIKTCLFFVSFQSFWIVGIFLLVCPQWFESQSSQIIVTGYTSISFYIGPWPIVFFGLWKYGNDAKKHVPLYYALLFTFWKMGTLAHYFYPLTHFDPSVRFLIAAWLIGTSMFGLQLLET